VDLDGFLKRAGRRQEGGRQERALECAGRRADGRRAGGRRAGGRRQPAQCSRKTQDKFAIASMTKKLLHCCIGEHARVHMHFCGESACIHRCC